MVWESDYEGKDIKSGEEDNTHKLTYKILEKLSTLHVELKVF